MADQFAAWMLKLKKRAESDEEPGTVAYRLARMGDKFIIWEQYVLVFINLQYRVLILSLQFLEYHGTGSVRRLMMTSRMYSLMCGSLC